MNDTDDRAQFAMTPKPAPQSLPIDPIIAGKLGPDLQSALRNILKSTAFEISESRDCIRLMGPDTSHHGLDTQFADVLIDMNFARSAKEPASFRTKIGPDVHFCVEDSWSGFALADELSGFANDEPVVLIHIDDHQDMMPTLLLRDGDELSDPASGSRFDAFSPNSLEAAIRSGCVGIGNFVTPFIHSCRQFHIVHLNNQPTQRPAVPIGPLFAKYPLFGDAEFASIGWGVSTSARTSTYRSDDQSPRLLRKMPKGRVIVHIDFDYFINDFNGNPGGTAMPVGTVRNHLVQSKLASFFQSLTAAQVMVEQWIVCASPGFCCSRHWPELLASLLERIDQLQGSRHLSPPRSLTVKAGRHRATPLRPTLPSISTGE